MGLKPCRLYCENELGGKMNVSWNESKAKTARESLLLRGFPRNCQEIVMKDAKLLEFKRGELLFHQGDIARGIHLVIDGWVKLYSIAPTGDEAIVSVFTKGEGFGEAVAFRGVEYPVSAEAVSNCEVMYIPSSTILEVMRRDPEIMVSVMASIFSHLHSLVSQLQQLKVQTGAQRVADFLLDLCEQEYGSCEVTLPYDKILIAGRLGMKPESLSRSFSRLKSIGVKIERNHAAIEDVHRLRTFLGKDYPESWDDETE